MSFSFPVRSDPSLDPSELLLEYKECFERMKSHVEALEKQEKKVSHSEDLLKQREDANNKLLQLAEKMMKIDKACDMANAI